MIRRMLLGLLATGLVISASFAADWPQWRGTNRDGKSGDTGLLKSWPKEGPKLLWKLDDVGTGYGSPAVVGDRLYLIGGDSAKKDSKDTVFCFSTVDGAKKWSQEFGTTSGEYLDMWGGGPRATPTIDGELLFALGATGDLVCMKVTDGSIVWTKNIVKDFGGEIPLWGYSESVLIDGDRLIITPGGAKAARGKKIAEKQKEDFKGCIVALDKKTGKLEWACRELEDPAGYSSVVISDINGTKVYVQQTMANAVGIQPKDGKLLWKTGEINRSVAVIPTPIIDGNLAFFTAGYGAGCELVEMSKDGAGVSAKLKYTKNKSLQNHHGGVIRNGDYVYGHSDSGGWTCLEFKKGEGEVAWQSTKLGKGSITFADDHFYCYSEDKGEIVLIEANANEWKEAGRFTIPAVSKKRPNQGKVWPHPVIANGKLYLRDYELLYVYDVKGGAAE